MDDKEAQLSRTHCAIARSLDLVGDWWSLLIIRNALLGERRFGQFHKSLGLAKNILSQRLQKLVDAGVLELAAASDGSAYREYVLTKKGRELDQVLAALWRWGKAHCFEAGETPFVPSGAEGKTFAAMAKKRSAKSRR